MSANWSFRLPSQDPRLLHLVLSGPPRQTISHRSTRCSRSCVDFRIMFMVLSEDIRKESPLPKKKSLSVANNPPNYPICSASSSFSSSTCRRRLAAPELNFRAHTAAVSHRAVAVPSGVAGFTPPRGAVAVVCATAVGVVACCCVGDGEAAAVSGAGAAAQAAVGRSDGAAASYSLT